MYWESALSSAAEIGIGIAGFSGIFAAISRRNSNGWSDANSILLDVLLAASVGAVFASLLPFLLFEIGLAPSQVWGLGSAIYGIWMVWIVSHRIRQMRATDPRSPLGPGAVALAVSAILLVNGVFFRLSWPFLLGVYWQLLVAFRAFLLLLRSTARDSNATP